MIVQGNHGLQDLFLWLKDTFLYALRILHILALLRMILIYLAHITLLTHAAQLRTYWKW